MFILIKLALVLVSNKGRVWDEASPITETSYIHSSLRIEWAATQGSSWLCRGQWLHHHDGGELQSVWFGNLWGEGGSWYQRAQSALWNIITAEILREKKKKRSQYLLWRPDDGAKQDAIWPCQPQEGKKIKMVLEQFGQEDNRILYFLAQPWMNLSSKCKAGIKSKDNKWWNGETSVPGTIMSFLCDHKENSPTELQRAVWTSIVFLSKDN